MCFLLCGTTFWFSDKRNTKAVHVNVHTDMYILTCTYIHDRDIQLNINILLCISVIIVAIENYFWPVHDTTINEFHFLLTVFLLMSTNAYSTDKRGNLQIYEIFYKFYKF